MASAARIQPMGAPSAALAAPTAPAVVLVAVPDLPAVSRGLPAPAALVVAAGLTAGLMVGVASLVGGWA